MDGMFRTACRYGSLVVGCREARCSWSRWRSRSELHQPGRRLDQDGKHRKDQLILSSINSANVQIDTLPTREGEGQPLQNVLSISTAGKNRFLLHFNNVNSLTQWTAGIRLSMFEHSTLQEAYTGSLIAGKGKSLNNINVIMDRIRFNYEDWARVRFGAGTPWRRCWCVISPPDDKEVAKQQKLNKKKSAYDRSLFVLKGEVRFYDTKRTKKMQPIATIKDAYSAYAIYPQSKPLIDQSTLVKVEGTITIHSTPETTTEGFVFVMPEVHPAVSGFEMMLRWLFPAYDVFALYGRPNRLIADTLDTRSLMFALPQERRYGYLEIFDVATLIHAEGSNNWSDREWRLRLKQLTSERMMRLRANGSRTGSLAGSRRGHRNSLPSRAGLRFEEESMRSSPSLVREFAPTPPPHTSTAPTASNGSFAKKILGHNRSVSEAAGYGNPQRQRGNTEGQAVPAYSPSRLSYEANHSTSALTEYPPAPPPHDPPMPAVLRNPQVQRHTEIDGTRERSSSESERRSSQVETQNVQRDMQPNLPPAPVTSPPAFSHQPGAKPSTRPYHSPELRRAKSRMSSTTLSELAAASNASAAGEVAAAGAAAAWKGSSSGGERHSEDQRQRGVNDDTSRSGVSANGVPVYEGMEVAQPIYSETNEQRPQLPPHQTPESRPLTQNGSNNNLVAPFSSTPRSVSPLSQISTHSSPPSPSPLHPTVSRETNGPTSQAKFPTNHKAPDLAPANPTSISPDNPQFSAEPYSLNSKRPSTSHSISRKPVGGVQNRLSPASVPAHQPSSESLRRYANDGDEVNGIHRRSASNASITSLADPHIEAVHKTYDDLRNPSPDYTTGAEPMSPATEYAPDPPRRGALKTVGPGPQDVVIGDVHYRKENPTATSNAKPAIPSIDFGPTFIPSTAKPQPVSHERTKSADRLLSQQQINVQQGAHGRISPSGPEQHRNRTPEPSGGRSIAWSPGLASGNSSPGSKGHTITAEQFVQQRAAAGRVTPVFAHARKHSGTPPNMSRNPSGDINSYHRKQSSTPPIMCRNSSGDWSQLPRRSPTPNDLPARPGSRSTSHMMSSSADYSTHLSAREQEHVARVTGSPLINVKANQKPTSTGQGLIGAIEAREREKKDIKEGLSGQMVQHAIAQRQQLAQQQQLQPDQQQQIRSSYASSQQGFPSPSPQLHFPGQYPQTPQTLYGNWASPGAPQQQYFAQGQQQAPYNQAWMSPSHQAYWSAGFSQPLTQQQQMQQYQAQQSQQSQQGQPYQQQGYFGHGQGGR